MSEIQICPKCNEECWRDEVDVGVGVLYGPWGCSFCGWSDDPHYDSSDGPSPARRENPDHYVDSAGGMIPLDGIAEKLKHFGLPGDKIVDEVFRIKKVDMKE